MNIRGIIFDFGRVIAGFDHLKACRALGEQAGIDSDEVYARLFNAGLTTLHESGELTSRDFYVRSCETLDLTDLSFEKFSDIWKDIFIESAGFSELMVRVRPDIPRCILSNTDPIHWSAIRKLPDIQTWFPDPDDWVLSFQVGARKPDVRMYEGALKRLDSQASDMLYLEDVPGYREAFRSLGGTAEAYDCSIDPVEKLLSIFSRYDLLI